MNDYTPDTERIKKRASTPAYESYDRRKRIVQMLEGEFDRWLAAHDARKEAQIEHLLLELAKCEDSLALARFDTDELHRIRTGGVSTEEPEWEYGVFLFGEPKNIRRRASEKQAMAALLPGEDTLARRRKAGPWVPVKQEPSPLPRTFPNPDNRDDDDGIGLLGGAPRW